MKDNFDDTLTDKQIKDLVTYIEEKELIQKGLIEEYSELYKSYVPIEYKPKRFIDKIFKKRYAKYLASFNNSQDTKQQLKSLNDAIGQYEFEIEDLKNFLYESQKKSKNNFNNRAQPPNNIQYER